MRARAYLESTRDPLVGRKEELLALEQGLLVIRAITRALPALIMT
jgi:hypothetical protein